MRNPFHPSWRLLLLYIAVAIACGTDVKSQPPDIDASQSDSEPTTFTEKVLTLALRFKITPGTGTDVPPVVTLDITAGDGLTPLITDLWLYNIDDTGAQVPMTGFTVPNAAGTPVATNRRSARLMLPAMVNHQPSGFPADLVDDGRENGIMTNTTRGTMRQGAFISAITGTVVITLPAAPTSPILVIAAKEDRRYAGAAVINPDGNPGVVPAGVGTPQTYTRRSFARDVAPITPMVCGACHNATHAHDTFVYK